MVAALTGAGFAEPDNPIGSDPDQLQAEVLDGNGQLTGESVQTPNGTQPPEETEPPTEPETEPTEPETEPETEPKDRNEPVTTAPAQDPDDTTPPENGDDHVGGQDPDNDDGGNSDDNEEDDGDAGDDGPGGGDGGDHPGDGDDTSPKIVTDLRNCMITRSELPDGVLGFYAYPTGEGVDLTVKVVLNNSQTSGNGETLQSIDGQNYKADLVLNEVNIITLFLKEQGENIAYVRYQISYEADKATEENPEVGDYPPSIITNLDDFTGYMQTQDFVFWVSARTNPDGDPIYSNQIEVRLNGEIVPKQTGDSRPEYELHFEPPNVGDEAEYIVKVLTWDGEGNSTLKVYTVNYRTVSEGDFLGEVTVVLDATTVGLGILDEATYEIVQGDTAAGIVIRFLEEYGYEATYDGSATVGFYLRRISRGDLCYRAQVPERLWEMILRDGIQLSGTTDRDSLGEYDYTMGSGWMYSINGQVYPGRGLSAYPLSDNDTLYLRFTLSYGKDIGGYDATGNGYGKLSSYCGIWINGTYQQLEHAFEETDRQEPTETEDGYIEYTCRKCGDSYTETLPATGGGDTQPPEDPDPTDPDPTDPEPGDPDPGDPDPTDPDPIDPGELPTALPPAEGWESKMKKRR